MAKSKDDSKLLVTLLTLAIIVSVSGVFVNLLMLQGPFTFTGWNTANQSGNVTFTQAGQAGITLTDAVIDFGSGYYNATCDTSANQTYSVLDSSSPGTDPKPAPRCWINTTAWIGFPSGGTDYHNIENNGSTIVKINASSNVNSKDFLCGFTSICSSAGANATYTATSNVTIKSASNETGSCLTAQTAYTTLTNGTANITVQVCDQLQFVSTNDTLLVYYAINAPAITSVGSHTMVVTYMAEAL